MTVDVTTTRCLLHSNSEGGIGRALTSSVGGSGFFGGTITAQPTLNGSTSQAGISGENHRPPLQKQLSMHRNNSSLLKADEIEVLESNCGYGATEEQRRIPLKQQHTPLGLVCCAPCIWVRTSKAMHKIAITGATLLVTSLLVASPILFLISTAPSSLPRDCFRDDEDCFPTLAPPPECSDPVCRYTATSILARMNLKVQPCKAFKEFTCATEKKLSLRAAKSPQEDVDLLMNRLLQHNTTTGPFQKLGYLYDSCLRQMINSTTIQLVLDRLGGYLPIGALGPSSITTLITNIYAMGPTPLIDIYYDLSYGRRPHILLIIGDPSTSAPILENKIRWGGPKAPPYRVNQTVPAILDELLDNFLPKALTFGQKLAEKESISHFIEQFTKIRVEHSRKGFWDSSVLYNTSQLNENYPFLNWTTLIPCNWTGPIVVRNSAYLKNVEELINKFPTRVSHNAILILFALGILPQGYPSPLVCTRATMWALPEIASAIYMQQYASSNLKKLISRTEFMFDALKAHLKRAPSLKGAALVKLSALKIQTNIWPGFVNMTLINEQLLNLNISSNNWFENVLHIYKKIKLIPPDSFNDENQIAWAYPIVSKTFYDALSHSIVVPLSVMLVPYFDSKLPPYIQYASVGVSIAKEILRSITKTFEDKTINCVPNSVNIFSNYSRMEILIHSGGMQISYHSMLSLTGPIRGMARLPGVTSTPTQTFFVVTAQEICAESEYNGIDTKTDDFKNILTWLIAQGGSATEVFKCPSGSKINAQKTCNVL